MKKLSKKILPVLLALVLVVAVATLAALAADGATVTYGAGHGIEDAFGKEYSDKITVTAAGGVTTIQLKTDVTLTKYLQPSKGKLVIDLAGYKLSSSSASSNYFTVVASGGCDLTIKDSSGDNKGELVTESDYSPLVLCGAGTKVTLESGTIKHEKDFQTIWAYEGGQLIMTGGKIVGNTNSAYCVVLEDDSCFTMKDGIIEGKALVSVNTKDKSADTVCFIMEGGNLKQLEGSTGPAVFLAKCVAKMSGGTITGGNSENTNVVTVGGYKEDRGVKTDLPATFTMTGGTVKSTGDSYSAVGAQCGSTVTISGDSKLIATDTGNAGAVYGDPGTTLNIQGNAELSGAIGVVGYGDVNISGGTINAAEYGVSAVKNDEKQAEAHGTIAITGGTINSKRVGVIVSDDREVTISGSANIQSTGSAATVFGKAKLNVQGGTLHSVNGQGISTNGSQSKDVTITVTGGDISSDNSVGVYLPAGTMNVSGDDTVVSGKAGIVQFGGTLNVKGGKIEATATGTVEVGSSGQAVPAAAVTTNKQSGYDDNLSAVIEDGEFVAAGTDTVVYTVAGSKNTTVTNTTFDVKGGYFSKSVDESYLDSTIKAEVQSSKGFSYYNSSAAAKKALNELEDAQPGKTIANSDGSADIKEVGFLTEANNDTLNKLAETVKGDGESWSKKITDCVDNTFYAAFSGAKTDTNTTYIVVFECGGKKYTESVTGVSKGGIVYFTPSYQPTASGLTRDIPQSNFQGEYTVKLYKDSVDDDNLVSEDSFTVYRVDYVVSTGVNGEEYHLYCDAKNLAEAKKIVPDTFKLNSDVNKWTYGESTDEKTHVVTIKIGGEYSSPIDPGHKCPTKGFKDMEILDTSKLWYHEAMDYMVLNGYIQGFPGNTLQPDGIATRAQLWVIMAQVKGVDVKSNPWYEAARKWAEENKYSDGLRPNDPIQREEIVKILWSIAGQPKPTKSLSDYKFGDAASVNDWAKTAMAWAIENGIMAGRDSNLVPQGIATRAELARFIYSYVTLMK